MTLAPLSLYRVTGMRKVPHVPTNTERMQAFRQCQPVQFANAMFTDIEGREYERQEMLDGRDMQARGFDDNADRFTFGG
jgi:hypothetical protein